MVLGKAIFVARELLLDRDADVNVARVGKTQAVDQHIGQLIGHFCAPGLIFHQGAAGLRGAPLKVLHDLSRFDRNAHRQVLGRVIDLPVPCADKLAHRGA